VAIDATSRLLRIRGAVENLSDDTAVLEEPGESYGRGSPAVVTESQPRPRFVHSEYAPRSWLSVSHRCDTFYASVSGNDVATPNDWLST
jgi:hypothetical protein